MLDGIGFPALNLTGLAGKARRKGPNRVSTFGVDGERAAVQAGALVALPQPVCYRGHNG